CDGVGSDFGVPRGWLRSPSPVPAEGLTMPAEEGVGPHNVERLCPVPDGSREHDQEQPIGPGTRWALHLTAEDHELLTEQRVLGDEFSSGAGHIVQCTHESRAARWFRPPRYMLLNPAE